MKYKVGDKVRVIPDLKEGTDYHDAEIVTEEMLEYAGAVTEVVDDDNNETYRLQCDGGDWVWPEKTLISAYHTNADKVRHMTDVELAKIIMCPYHTEPHLCGRKECMDCCIEWLQKPYEQEIESERKE